MPKFLEKIQKLHLMSSIVLVWKDFENNESKNCFHNKEIKIFLKVHILQNKNKIIDSLTDLYIIALGINDFRYRDSSNCAMNPNEYIYQIDKIVKLTKNHKSNALFILHRFSMSNGYISKFNHKD